MIQAFGIAKRMERLDLSSLCIPGKPKRRQVKALHTLPLLIENIFLQKKLLPQPQRAPIIRAAATTKQYHQQQNWLPH
jgi:hypothetical protein